ncbi:MAG: N(4)-(beta-N-acetylglucosaminyl)-L-asparaginase [Fimbriimonadales bacterium]|nr:N(4)-(beta-N-acetylglucosaminyl)-L-asparaginase [Fimbriimonadales bacterium]
MQTLFAATWWFGQIAVEAAQRRWQESPERDSALRLLEAVVEGAAAVERDPQVLSVGYGGLPNRDGEVELDAAVMEGGRLRAGAVGAVRGFLPAIYLARAVMERTPHLMLVGDGAARFALCAGYEPQQLLTPESLRRWHEWRQQQTAPKEVSPERGSPPAESHDTVGVLGWNAGHLVAACTTSGLAWKLPGRVGDSPIVGAGLYADNEAGAAVCTGVGEEIWRFALASRVVEAMRNGYSAQRACQQSIEFMLRRLPDVAAHQCAVIAIRADGTFGLAATQPEKFEAFLCRDGVIERVRAHQE